MRAIELRMKDGQYMLNRNGEPTLVLSDADAISLACDLVFMVENGPNKCDWTTDLDFPNTPHYQEL